MHMSRTELFALMFAAASLLLIATLLAMDVQSCTNAAFVNC
jgi:hypothetical protein